jgi:hypothetical protein
MAADVEFYRTHSRWSDPRRWTSRLAEIPPVPDEVVRGVSGLFLHPFLAPMRNVEVPAAAVDDRELRTVEAILDRVLGRDGSALTAPRATQNRFFCVCSGFARLAVAVLRTHRVPARVRVGFAGYFFPRNWEDHWVCEYWDGRSWHLLDAQLDETAVRDFGVPFPPSDVPRERFLDASTAWCRLRAGELDPARIGLPAMQLAGAWFVAQSVLRDVAALNKEEMLPWETWSVGREFGPGQDVPPARLAGFDAVARVLCGTPDAALAARVYREHAWLEVTPSILSFLNGPKEVVLS